MSRTLHGYSPAVRLNHLLDKRKTEADADGRRARAVVMSSDRPSTRKSCAGSPERFSKGRTTSDGLSGSGKAMLATLAASTRVTHGCQMVTT